MLVLDDMTRKKRGEIWISAVLFFALGIIVIAMVLSASLPVVEKLKDRAVVAESKEVLLALDSAISTVAREGPGSRREITSLTVNEGRLFIDSDTDLLRWEMKTSALIMEPDIPLREGVLSMMLHSTPVKGDYLMNLSISYHDRIDLLLESEYQSPFFGKYSMLISHKGNYTLSSEEKEIPVVTVKVT